MPTKKKVAKKKKKAISENTSIPIKWNIPDDVISRFATNMVVQLIENEFKVSFFEIKPDIRTDLTLPAPEEIRADCISSLIITPDRMLKFIEALQGQYNRFIELKTKGMEELED